MRNLLRCSLALTILLALMIGIAKAESKPPEKHPKTLSTLETPFTFAVIADPHCAEKAGRGYPESVYGSHMDRFMRCVQEMKKQKPEARPDFILIVGDIHLEELKKHFDKIKIPIHVIAGNHESGKWKKYMRKLFPQDFQINGKPSDYYSFLHKGVRFIGVCDAGAGGDHIGHLASEDIRPRGQCEWLEKNLINRKRTRLSLLTSLRTRRTPTKTCIWRGMIPSISTS